MVSHSHDDVGWLKTVDQYFFGARSDIQYAGVQYIIDSVVEELTLDPEKRWECNKILRQSRVMLFFPINRFIQVETGFFYLWWNEQTEEEKTLVRQLIEEGRLEIAGGGWSMADEAATHYSSFIDNLAAGLNTIKDELGRYIHK